MSLKRCDEYIILEKTTIFDFSFEGDRRIRCARVDGHTGSHSFISNGKRIEVS